VSCVASKAVSSVSTGRAGALTLARPMFDLDGQRVARSARDLKSIAASQQVGSGAIVESGVHSLHQALAVSTPFGGGDLPKTVRPTT